MVQTVFTVYSLTLPEIEFLFNKADGYRAKAQAVGHGTASWEDHRPLAGKVMASLFFEPSTRTRLSFESAMLRLGGHVVSVADGRSASAAKGESVWDSIRAVSEYADILVVRSGQTWQQWGLPHPTVRPRLVNAGSGSSDHPTQALLDVYTVRQHRGGQPVPPNLSVGVVGDLTKSRTCKSFVDLMGRGQGNRFVCHDSAGNDGRMGATVAADIEYVSAAGLDRVLPDLDVLYLNRIQEERWPAGRTFAPFVLTPERAAKLKPTCLVLNPGPRRDELPPDLDGLPMNKMWEQVRNGLYVRMALLRSMLGAW